MSLDILRMAARLSGTQAVSGYPADTLRITLEYPSAPDLDAEREKISDLLEGGNFDLGAIDELLPEFLVLQFAGIERRMAPDTLFAAADALVEPLGLVSAVPDIATTFVVAPEDLSRVEGAGDLFLSATCWVKEDKTLPKDWSIDSIRARQAWAMSKGDGVIIAQPDTGVAEHSELAGALDIARGFNTLTGTADPTDPLATDMKNPGHGTSTASAVASRAAGEAFGSAPGAKVAPVRCLNSVVLGLDPTPVAKAILHAVKISADVISMSLGGGFHSPVMAKALERAAASGIVTIAAGGNCVQPIVVYPARDRNVIAMGGVNVHDKPWKGSSRGRRIDVSAPAENVFVARRSPDDHGIQRVKPSQGTSYATALTAGVAALWVGHFGRSAVRAEASRRGITVNELFRSAVKASARPPKSGSWNSKKFGAGIVDAQALLKLQLTSIPVAAPLEEAEPVADDEVVAALETAFTSIETNEAQWDRIGAEAVFLLNDAWLRTHRSAAIPMESPARPHPSEGLRKRMPASVARGLESASAGPEMVPPTVGEVAAVSYTKMLAAGSAQGTESSAALSLEAAQAQLRNGGKERLLQKVAKAVEGLEATSDRGNAERRQIVQMAAGVIEKAADNRFEGFDMNERVTLEALVRINDRPSYRVINGTIDPNDPLFGEWGGFLALLVGLEDWTASVGRVNLDGVHIGTGFLMGDGRVMTNRHVLEACADEIFGPGGSNWDFGRGKVTVDFSDTADGSKVFELTHVVQTGSRPIRGIEMLENLDMAILGMAPGQTGTPRALPFAKTLDPAADLMVIGFPARPGTSALIDPATGSVSKDIAERLRAIFGTDYGRKYVSPGRILQAPGTLTSDTKGWVATHDSTTLGGFSGSVVVQLTADPAVAGLHFSGAPLMSNKAHALGIVDQSAAGPIDGANWL